MTDFSFIKIDHFQIEKNRPFVFKINTKILSCDDYQTLK